MVRLAEALVREEQTAKAIEILDLCMEKMPLDYFGYYALVTPIVAMYYQAGAEEKASTLALALAEKYTDKLRYYSNFSAIDQQLYAETILTDVERLRDIVDAAVGAEDTATASQLIGDFTDSSRLFAPLYSAYDYYTPMAAYVSVLFGAEMPESGRMLFDAIAQAYQNRLAVFSQVPEEELSYYTQSIRLEVDAYQRLLEIYQETEPNLDSVSAANEAFRKATSPYVAD
jgi:hypothetical protein